MQRLSRLFRANDLSAIKEMQEASMEYVLRPNPLQDFLNVILQIWWDLWFEFSGCQWSGAVKNLSKQDLRNQWLQLMSRFKKWVYILHFNRNGNNISSKKFIKK